MLRLFKRGNGKVKPIKYMQYPINEIPVNEIQLNVHLHIDHDCRQNQDSHQMRLADSQIMGKQTHCSGCNQGKSEIQYWPFIDNHKSI